MKIPTQQNNVKRAALVVTGIAVIAGLAVPTATFAYGGSSGTGMDRSSHHDNRGGSHDNNWNQHKSSWSFWEQISAEDFNNWNGTKLSRIDSFVAKNNLQVENGASLRAAVDTDATAVVDSLTALNQLRDSVGDIKNATDEQRTTLKEQSTVTFSAYYDYKLSLYDYTVAIKAAADSKGAAMDSSIQEDSQ